jgi:hypothetical protein
VFSIIDLPVQPFTVTLISTEENPAIYIDIKLRLRQATIRQGIDLIERPNVPQQTRKFPVINGN